MLSDGGSIARARERSRVNHLTAEGDSLYQLEVQGAAVSSAEPAAL